MLRGSLTLLNRDTGEIFIEAAYGLSPSQKERGRYRLGEGATGRVVQTGLPAVVPRISRDPLFLDRTGARKRHNKADISFICVPIKVEENQRLQEELQDRFRPSNIIGNSKPMQAVYDLIAQVSESDATALIRGESGVGKELVAAAIHYNSRRSALPFVKVNLAALPETIIESELFGHEKGAFTGTIFLDEIGDLSPTTQVKLLRVIQEREFERVGGNQNIRVDVRIIAATNRDLEALSVDGRFRQDLYYRLNVFPIHIPALRERKADIMLLSDHFYRQVRQDNPQDSTAHRHASDRPADELPLAGQRPRA